MPFSEAALRWFQPVAVEQQQIVSSSPSPVHTASSTDSENVDPHPPAASKKRRHVSEVVDVDEMVSDGFMCCNKLRCVEKFVLGKADVASLRAEQRIMSGLSGKSRSSFVHTMIPSVHPGRSGGAMVAGRQLVCSAFYRRAFNVSNNMIQSQKGNAGAPALNTKKRARLGTATELKDACLGHIDRFSEMFGQSMPHLNATYLYLGSMQELYDDFAKEQQRLGNPTPSYTYFTRIWKKNRSHVKPKTGGDFMKCYECTVYKDTRFGSPGIRASTDLATLASAKKAHEKHLKIIELDRACLLRNEQRALEAKHNGDPLRNVSVQADAAGQIGFGLPMQDNVTHGTDRGYSERQKVHAVIVEGQFVEVFLTPQNLGGGCNLICTSLHLVLHRLFKLHVPFGTRPYIHHLTVQVDNCVENKNHILLGYLGHLVVQGIIGQVEVHFMPVGHTHIKIDQVFSRFAIGCKNRNLFTRKEQAAAFSAAYKTLPVHTTTLRNLGNFKGVFPPGPVVRNIHGITKSRAFQLLKDGPSQVTVGMKEYMHHEAYTGLTGDGVFAGEPHELFVGGVPDPADAPPFQLKDIDKATLDKIQQRYDSVHPRLEALYPDDPAKRNEYIREMNLSVQLLRERGTKDWDLPSLTSAAGLDDSSDDDSSDDDSSEGNGNGDNGALDTVSPQALPDGSLVGGGGGGPGSGLHLQPGWFAVFPLELSNPCPLVVGKIVSVDLSAGNGGELTVTWFSPASRKKCRRSKYGRGVWSQEFLKEGNKLTADQGTESVEAVCFTFPSLLQSGKLPSAVWDAVEESVPTSSLEESDSEVEEEQGGERAGGDPGGERSAIVQPPTAPPPERATTPIPNPRSSATPALRPPPAPGVLLTAAHFRPRRGQERTE